MIICHSIHVKPDFITQLFNIAIYWCYICFGVGPPSMLGLCVLLYSAFLSYRRFCLTIHRVTCKNVEENVDVRSSSPSSLFAQELCRIECTIYILSTKSKPNDCLAISLSRSSADADNRCNAFSGQSRSTNMVPFWVHCDFPLSMWSAPRITTV